jgi:hypothetical protein
VSATWAILASTMVGLVGLLVARATTPRAIAAETPEVQ